MRICKKCNQEKPINAFVKAKQCKLGFSYTCRECNWKIRSPQYKANRKERAAVENKKNRDRKSFMVSLFGNKCFDCNQSYPDCVYDFHHLDPTIKDFKLSSIRSMDIDKINKELSKCVMLCSNCHRVRHWLPRKEGEHATIN